MSDIGKQGSSIPAGVTPPCEGGKPVDTGKGNGQRAERVEGHIPPIGKGNPNKAH